MTTTAQVPESVIEGLTVAFAFVGAIVGSIMNIGSGSKKLADGGKATIFRVASSILLGSVSLSWSIINYYPAIQLAELSLVKAIAVFIFIGCWFLMCSIPGSILYNILDSARGVAEENSKKRIGEVLESATAYAKNKLEK